MALVTGNVYHHNMATQDDYIKTALRLPRALHAELLASAESKGRSLNAELIANLQGQADKDSAPLVQVIARQNANISELEVNLHALQLKATALAQYLRVFTDLLKESNYSTHDGFELLFEKSNELAKDFPPEYDSLRKVGEEKMKQYREANDKLTSLIQNTQEFPISEAQSQRAVKRILDTRVKKTK